MSHLLASCRESHFVANTRFLGLCCADFWDLTQVLHRYLDQKSAANSSALALPFPPWVSTSSDPGLQDRAINGTLVPFIDFDSQMVLLMSFNRKRSVYFWALIWKGPDQVPFLPPGPKFLFVWKNGERGEVFKWNTCVSVFYYKYLNALALPERII